MSNKYTREIKPGVFVDVYDVLGAFTGHYPASIKPIMDHLTKKALAGGQRGHKDMRQDIVDIINSAERALEILDEDAAKPNVRKNTSAEYLKKLAEFNEEMTRRG
tara:strand:- start:26677 stop:26991 length:315 start_codon:yes stop_codon:yes gene_type:complete